ncbi:MAG: asparagine synthase (glutamine-hydrolyzing) [Pseudomonadota bacterium]|nr:asparagine synthase (glutamine-hydrolyzing) [Pseudomonadota bacterium]
MCGIAGAVGPGARDELLVGKMIATIVHRGPDDEGVWVDAEAGVALGQQRLAIVDLSPAGHQPMVSANGRFVIDFNGEVYNHSQVRSKLEVAGGAPEGGWRGHSDTETLIEAIATWGLEAALAECAGMFAFALWDRSERRLSLVRDRFGEKPLYYGWVGRDFLFGSELKALRAHPQFDNPIEPRALHLLTQRGYIPAPLSIYRRIFKLEPASILTLSPEAATAPMDEAPGEAATGPLRLTRYWSYRQVVEDGLADPIRDEADALDQLEQALGAAIRDQSLADVPVGAFLSGGIDSSTIVALGQKQSSTPMRTFSIGFEEAPFNEAEHAAEVAKHLGTVHNEHYVTVREARDVIPLLPAMYDEPFADSSQIPTFLVSRFAREQVTVALTGDGGDELFGGYNRHFHGPRLWDRIEKVPPSLRAVAGAALGRLPAPVWQGAASLLAGQRQPSFAPKLQKALRVSGSARSFEDAYRALLNEWSFEQSPVLGAQGTAGSCAFDCGAEAPNAVRAMYCDAIDYLPGDILCKVDRASMAVSLETRVPFLDHRVAALAARIPIEMKVRGGTGKAILRKLLYRHVPRELVERPKAGFAVPVGEWLKGPLRAWGEELLDPLAMAAEGWFDSAVVQRRWRDHLSGRRDSTAALWSILMFQAWLRAQRDEIRAAA